MEEETEIDLRSGIYPNETLYMIGPRLTSSKNAVWGYRYPQADDSFSPNVIPPHFLRVPTLFPSRAAITYGSDPAMFLDLAFTQNTGNGRKKLIIGTNSAEGLRAWEAETGTVLALDAGVTNSIVTTTSTPRPATSTYWVSPGGSAHITGPAIFFSHPSASKIYYVLDSAAVIRSMNDDGIVGTPAGALALTVHLDRLWMAREHPASVFSSNIWFTDPFDVETIRPESFVTIDDEIVVMAPSIPGQIDSSGTAHLFVGCSNSIWMIDGDPTSVQALRRQIASNIGIRSPLAMAVTQYGIFFVGTDNQIYLCSTDGRTMIPVGDPIRNRISVTSSDTLDTGYLAALTWFPPYLYYFPTGNPLVCYIADMTNPNKPTWWGAQSTGTFALSSNIIIKSSTGWSVHAPAGVNVPAPSPAIYAAGKLSTSTGFYSGFDRFTKGQGVYPHGFEDDGFRSQNLVTGHFSRQGQRVVPARVTLETSTKQAAYTWTVQAINARGESIVGVLHSSTPIRYANSEVIQKHLYTFAHTEKSASPAVRFQISGPSSAGTESVGMGLQKLRAVVKYLPENT